MGDKLNRMRAAAALGQSKPRQVAAKPEVTTAPTTATARCGHEVAIPAGFKVDHLEARRKKLAAKLCTACNEAEQTRLRQEAIERRKARGPRKSKPWVCSGCKNVVPDVRLPAGSTFQSEWDGEKWSVTLSVPDAPKAYDAVGPAHFGTIRQAFLQWAFAAGLDFENRDETLDAPAQPA